MATHYLHYVVTCTNGVTTGYDVDGAPIIEIDGENLKAIHLEYKPQFVSNGPTASYYNMFNLGMALNPDTDTPTPVSLGSNFNQGFN